LYPIVHIDDCSGNTKNPKRNTKIDEKIKTIHMITPAILSPKCPLIQKW